jgi:endoglucanase
VRVALLAFLLAVCLLVPASANAAVTGNPMAVANWYVDPGSAAAAAQRRAEASGDLALAGQLAVIAGTPQATWFIAVDDPATSGYVREWTDRWRAAGSPPAAIALHGLPHQVCAGDNAPGHDGAAGYRRWIDHWARFIGGHRFVVFLEPDALASSKCLSRQLQAERIGLMAYAARTLSQLPQTAVYEDIGAGDWLSLREAARLLKAAGVRYVRGFSLNVTHFDWTTAEVAYGRKLSRLVGNKHFVVNTSGNGRGPEIGARNFHMWCNPRGRALGPVATAQTANPLADGYFWVGNPGLSDGTCNGGPTVGAFWLQWAVELASNATRAPDFPAHRFRR